MARPIMSLPTGPAVTFLFTDIEGSTRLERTVGSGAWAEIVARHDALLREAIESNGGVVVKTEGDAFFAAFAVPSDGLTAIVAAQRAVAAEPWPDACQIRVRMGAHLGEGRLRAGGVTGDPEDYVGIDVNYTARIAAAANGGQVVLSDALVAALAGEDRRLETEPDVAQVDEGLRAVKDFEEPVRLFRLSIADVADDARALRTLDPPTNLPGALTELVGRETEIADVRASLQRSRIVTLTGPGGSGKTRLALAVAAAERPRFAHGTWFIDLAALRDPALVPASIGLALGLRESKDRGLPEVLADHLRHRDVLLVLDNLEQLLPAAATTVADLARTAPGLRVLATSRELLRITGEHGHPVPPLGVAAGVELFEARAFAHRPGLSFSDADRTAVRGICERVQGLPLAIELAAARVRLLSPALILDRLSSSLDLTGGSRDLPERQRTLRGAIDWSHDLLTEEERRLFRRLGVFAGGWTAELALQVADADGDLGLDVLEGLESLADKSLVRIEPASDGEDDAGPRFDLHPLLREYAAERLDASGERAAVEARHVDAMVVLAEACASTFLGPSGAATLRRLDREQHNVRAALDWVRSSPSAEAGLRILAAIWRWYQLRGQVREGRAWLAELLARPADDPRLRIPVLAAEGGLAYWAGDMETARRVYQERLDLAEASGDAALITDAHYDIGFTDLVAGDIDGFRAHEQLAYDGYVAGNRADGVLRARQSLALATYLSGDHERALALETDNLAEFRRAGSTQQIADSLTLHSALYYRLGDPAASWAWMMDALRLFAEGENPIGLLRGTVMAAILMLEHGNPEEGTRIAGTAYELARDKGLMMAPVKVLRLPDPEGLANSALGEARTRELLAEGAGVPVDEVVARLLATSWEEALTMHSGSDEGSSPA